MRLRRSLASALACLVLVVPAAALDETEKELERYRQMLKDDPWSNPAHARCRPRRGAVEGEAWPQATHRSKACDLGKGPGKVEGAFAELPRYFRDADRVMDLETRLVWCMEKLQGLAHADIVKRPYSKANQAGTELEALATYVASKSRGLKYRAAASPTPRRSEALAVGEALFFRRQGPMDFSCATCHADTGRRIRLQSLPFLGKPEEARKVIGEWPAYRVSQGTVMTMQHRIADCYWQMRLPLIDYGSDVTVALDMYLVEPGQGRGDHRAQHQALAEPPPCTVFSWLP